MSKRGWGAKRGRKTVAAIVLAVMGRGLVACARLDSRVAEEIASWPDPCVVTLAIAPSGPRASWRREGSTVEFLGSRAETPDLLVTFKSVDGAIPILLGQQAVLDGFAEHRATVRGDLAHAMSLVRCLHVVEGYLFPDFMTGPILPHKPVRSAGHLRAYATLVHTRANVEGAAS